MDKLDSYDTVNGPAIFAPRDNWVNSVAALLPDVIVGGDRTPTILVGPNPGEGLADREVRVLVQWRQPGEDQTRQLVTLNRIHFPDK
jgi:hypothetical protein